MIQGLVFVDQIKEGTTKVGLTEDSIQTDLELKLRLAGMRVVDFSLISLYVDVNPTRIMRAQLLLTSSYTKRSGWHATLALWCWQPHGRMAVLT